MRRESRHLLLGLIALVAVTLPGPTRAWETRIDGTQEEEFSTGDRARSVALDASGNIFIGGTLRNSLDGGDFLLARFHPSSGDPIWLTRLHGTAGPAETNTVSAVALDDNGDLLAVGYMTDADLNLAVVKVDGDTGAEIWRRTFDGTEPGFLSSQDFGLDLALDASGNAIAVGTLQNAISGKDFVLIKLDGATGGTLWQADIDGPAGDLDEALAVTVTVGDDIVAAGVMEVPTVGRDFAVVRVDGATGAVAWQRTLDAAGSPLIAGDAATSVAEDPDGHIIAGGRLLTDVDTNDYDFVVTRLDGATGETLWQTRVAEGATGTSMSDSSAGVSDLRLTDTGDVIAIGRILNPGPSLDGIVVRLDGLTGAEMWRREVTGTAPNPDSAIALTLDTSGNVLATGALSNVDRDRDLMALKLDGASGDELWRLELDGGGGEFDQGLDIAVDRTGAAVVAGQLSSTPSPAFEPFSSDLAVPKLSPVSGDDFVDEDGDGLSDDDPGYVRGVVTGLPAGSFDNRGDPEGQRNALLSRLADAEAAIAAGDLEDALRMLRNLRRHVDGCEDGPPADVNDWIVDCPVQDDVRRLLDALIASLEALVP